MGKDTKSTMLRAEIIGITMTAVLMLGFMGTPIQLVFAAGAAGTLDPNGLLRLNPLGNNSPFRDSYSLSYDSEYYIGDARKNFRSDGSMRIDWEGKPNPMTDTDGVMLAGYFNIDLGGERTTANDCTANPGEEISMKMNGGPHSDSVATWADTQDSGVIRFHGDSPSRVRAEPTHPDYSSAFSSNTLPNGWTFGSTNLCTVPGGWVGAMAFKINVDKTGDGKADAVRILHYVDESGLLNGKPQNKWELVYYREFTPTNFGGLKSIFQPYVCTINECDEHQESIRIDEQSQSRWQSTTNPPYKFVTYKEIVVPNTSLPTTTTTTPTPEPEPEPEPTPEPTPTTPSSSITIAFTNVREGQTLSSDYEVVVTSSNPGETENIQLYVDSTFIKTESSAPYEFDIDTQDFSDGNHILKAIGLDEDGNTVTKTVTANFNN
jgi:Bacterial Ig domain